MTFTIRIDLPIPSVLNPNSNRTGYANKFTIRDAKDALGSATAIGILNARKSADNWLDPMFERPVKATLTIYRKRHAQEWDKDNVISAGKFGIWDILQHRGVVADDKLIDDIKVVWETDRASPGYMILELGEVVKHDNTT